MSPGQASNRGRRESFTFGGHPEDRALHRHVLIVLIDVTCERAMSSASVGEGVERDESSPDFFEVPKSEILHIPS